MSQLTLELDLKFPVHPDYAEYKDQWQRCRDVLAGSDKVKAAGTKYLPSLSGQLNDAYKAYKQRALFFGISGRILSTNSGVVVRRTPTLDYVDTLKPYFDKDSIDLLSFEEVFRKTLRELMSTGRVGTYIDIRNNEPVPVVIPTENIINWIIDDKGNTTTILLVMSETKTDPITFTSKIDQVYYRLFLAPNGIFTVEKYNQMKESLGTLQPALRGKTLKYIPFTCANTFGLDIAPLKSPMLDIVDINLSHYTTSADLENGRHFIGLPQPVVTGANSENPLRVGETTAWIIPSKDAKAYYMEFLGQGLGSLERALVEKQSQMSQFSAQLMDTSTRGSEAEGTVRLRYSSDAANLSDLALSTESLLRQTYGYIADWKGVARPSIELNKDFISTKMSYQELLALHKAVIEGSITEEVFNYNLAKGEIRPEDMVNVVRPKETVTQNTGGIEE